MIISSSEHETVFPFSSRLVGARDMREQNDALTAQLQAAVAREEGWIREKHDLSQRQVMLAQEFEHWLKDWG